MTDEKTYKFGEEYSQEQLEGEKIMLNAVLEKEITIKAYIEIPGQYVDNKTGEVKSFLIVQAIWNNKLVTFPCGSGVVMAQLKRVKADNKFPIIAKIVELKGKESKQRYFALA